jgi:type IV secretion system protein VirB8
MARTAWIVAGAAVLVAVLEAIAIVVMMPLKTTQPYTILVDRQTGYVQTAQGLRPGALTQNDAVTQSFLVQYVLARETFDVTDLKDNYRKVQIWSAAEARAAYLREMSENNPRSPIKAYPSSTVVSAVVKSVSILGPGSALVRFDAERRDAGSSVGTMQPYSAVIAYRYSGQPLRMEDRFINPLGFQVTRYRRDAETTGALPVSQP